METVAIELMQDFSERKGFAKICYFVRLTSILPPRGNKNQDTGDCREELG